MALLTALTTAASPPAIVRPYFDPIDDVIAWERNFNKSQREIEAKVDRWERDGQQSLAQLATLARLAGTLDGRQLDFMVRAAEAIEQKCAEYADEMSRAFKHMGKLVRRMADVSANHQRVVAAAASRLEVSWEREIQARLDAALFFRALRAQYEPEAWGGKVFDNSDQLQKYLDKLIA